ncbi:putative structure-specific recognition protein [Helianthus annuus]|nr:FACT complex subunit SSRP1 [Helianthus annuus]XP_035830726.1 FACT complex subunit SSRP1 [Helianthus annuus]KAF5823110.1 putative structure-specific recognition protein [Helianthus annuus]KAJ0957957.1 putative structure-specific recognition protein [Helianthus annuus]
MNEDLFATKYKDKLEPTYKGLIYEVFTMVLRGLSGTKLTSPGKFHSCQDGYAVKSSLKAEDGVLYPLEKSFFFLPKPPTLILYDEMAKYSKCKLEFSKCQRKDIGYVWQKYLVAKEEFGDEEVNCESSPEQAANFLFWFRLIHFR